MGKSISDRIASKISGKDIETIYIPLEEMVEMVDKLFIQPADNDEEKKAVLKTCKGGLLIGKKMTSKDGNYELQVETNRRVGIFNMKNHNYMWIKDINANKFYEYRAFFWGKLKKAIKNKVES